MAMRVVGCCGVGMLCSVFAKYYSDPRVYLLHYSNLNQ